MFPRRIHNQQNSRQQSCSTNANGNNNANGKSSKSNKNCNINISPAEALVIGGLLTGALEVFSLLIDVEQNIAITIIGSFKDIMPDNNSLSSSQNTPSTCSNNQPQNSTSSEASSNANVRAIFDQLGNIPVNDVLRAIVDKMK